MNIDSQKQMTTPQKQLVQNKLDSDLQKKTALKKNIDKNREIKDKVEISTESLHKAKHEQVEKPTEVTTKVLGTRFVNKPAIFFIGGFNFFSASTNDGMKEMAAHVKGARFYGWEQKSEVVKEISKRPAHQPVILVGHSLGGDTAVEIANELNSLEHNFRKVDLLATLDSFGFNNDIIPQNVTKNLNFIGHKSLWLNDGPNIARNTHETEVINELRDEEHTELDDSEQIQYTILKAINKVMAEHSKSGVKGSELA